MSKKNIETSKVMPSRKCKLATNRYLEYRSAPRISLPM